MEVDYYSKYLKYKSKYLELKAQLGGDCKEDVIQCTNLDFCSQNKTYVVGSPRCTQFQKNTICEDCNHHVDYHTKTKGLIRKTKNGCAECKCESYKQSLTCGRCPRQLKFHVYNGTVCKSKSTKKTLHDYDF